MKCALILIFLLLVTGIHSAEAQTDDTCPDALPGRLVVGEFGRVTPGSSNNLRAEPSRQATTIGQIPGEGEFLVLDGPQCADGLIWWNVDFNGIVGWTVEGANGEYWLEPLDRSSLPCVSNLTIGEQAEHTFSRQGSIYVEPTWNSEAVGEIPEWTLFDVIGGPACDDYSVWVEVHYDGVTGWFMEMAKGLFDCYMCSDEELYVFARLPLRPLEVVEPAPDEDTFLIERPVLAPDAITLNNVDQVETLQILGEGSPRGFAWSPDESHIAISGSDHIRIYNVNRLNTPAHIITGFEALVNRGQYSPDGRWLMAGDQAGVVRIWDAADYQLITRMVHDGAVNATVFSSDGQMLAVNGASAITVWSLSDPSQPVILHEIPVQSEHMEFVFNDTRLLYISPDAINVLDLVTGDLTLSETRPASGHSDVYQWVVSPDGRCITALISGLMGGGGVFYGEYRLPSWSISGEAEDCVQLPGVHYGEYGVSRFASMVYGLTNRSGFINIESELWTFEGWTWDPILQHHGMELIAHHPSSYLLAISTQSGEVRLYWYRDALNVGAVLYGINGRVTRLEFSPDGNYIAASGWDNSIRVWRIEDQRRLGSVVYQHFGSGFVPGADESTIFSDKYVWDLSTGQQSPLPEFPAGNLRQVRPDGNFVIYAPQAGIYSIYNLEDDRLISEVVMESPTFRQTISQDGSRMAYIFTDRYDNKSVRVIDLDDGRMMQHWERLWDEPYRLLFSPDNRFLLVYEGRSGDRRDAGLFLLEIETGDLLVRIPLSEGADYIPDSAMAYSLDGTRIAWMSFDVYDQNASYILHIFDLPSMQEITTVEIPSFNRHMLFNADGSLIVLAGRSSVIHLLDSTTGQEIRALEGHLGDISQIMFSRDGRRLYSTAADSQLRVWGVAP